MSIEYYCPCCDENPLKNPYLSACHTCQTTSKICIECKQLKPCTSFRYGNKSCSRCPEYCLICKKKVADGYDYLEECQVCRKPAHGYDCLHRGMQNFRYGYGLSRKGPFYQISEKRLQQATKEGIFTQNEEKITEIENKLGLYWICSMCYETLPGD